MELNDYEKTLIKDTVAELREKNLRPMSGAMVKLATELYEGKITSDEYSRRLVINLGLESCRLTRYQRIETVKIIKKYAAKTHLDSDDCIGSFELVKPASVSDDKNNKITNVDSNKSENDNINNEDISAMVRFLIDVATEEVESKESKESRAEKVERVEIKHEEVETSKPIYNSEAVVKVEAIKELKNEKIPKTAEINKPVKTEEYSESNELEKMKFYASMFTIISMFVIINIIIAKL